MTLNSTVRIPPRTRKVSPLRTGRYAARSETRPLRNGFGQRTFQEVWLEVNVEDVAAQTLDRIVEGKDVYALSVLDIQAWVHVDHIAELHAEVVTGNLVHLDLALLDFI